MAEALISLLCYFFVDFFFLGQTFFEGICRKEGVYCPQKHEAGDAYGTAQKHCTNRKTG